jgi:hypothetical protein
MMMMMMVVVVVVNVQVLLCFSTFWYCENELTRLH